MHNGLRISFPILISFHFLLFLRCISLLCDSLDGSFYLCTRIDPLFLILPLLEKGRKKVKGGGTEGGTKENGLCERAQRKIELYKKVLHIIYLVAIPLLFFMCLLISRDRLLIMKATSYSSIN